MSNSPSEISQTDIVFCFWSYNDIDHMVPIIYRINRDDSRVQIKCVIFNLTEDYHDDYRIIFLLSLGVKIEHIGVFCDINAQLLTRLLRRTQQPGNSIFYRIANTLSYRLFWKKLHQKLELSYKKLTPSRFLKKAFGNTTGILVTDYQINPKYDLLIHEAKKSGHVTVAVPHGPCFGTACISRDWDPFDDHQMADLPLLRHDYVIYANSLQADISISKGKSERDRSLVLGSARFCKEWVYQQSEILPNRILPQVPEQMLKIVIMSTKPEGRLYKDELDRVMSYISDFPNIYLVIKSHTRGAKYIFESKKNVSIVGNDVPSPNLIDWADLTLFTHSSIVLENIRKDKPVLFLKRVVQDRMIHEQVLKEWTVVCQEELRDFIWRFINNKKCRSYSEKERDNCLRSFVEPIGEDVLGYYSDFFLTQLKNIKKTT